MTDQTAGSGEQPRRNQPIFILGILPRSGTNFLWDLLRAHPDCGPPDLIWEDLLVRNADLLSRYVDTVHAQWDPKWGIDEAVLERLWASLGSGLISFLTERSEGKRLVTKTPRVDNLDCFFKLFPDACLLILVRDGRSIVESGIKSFRWHRDSAIHHWARAAQTILDFDEAHRNTDRNRKYRIVRYEDLWANPEEETRKILAFLELDERRYDFEAAANLPVRGSSTVRQENRDLHWNPVEKTSGFDPLSRFRHWSRARHERFNWIAGDGLATFGYEPKRWSSTRWFWTLWNVVHDGKWLVIRTLGPLYLVLRRRREENRRRRTSESPAAR